MDNTHNHPTTTPSIFCHRSSTQLTPNSKTITAALSFFVVERMSSCIHT